LSRSTEFVRQASGISLRPDRNSVIEVVVHSKCAGAARPCTETASNLHRFRRLGRVRGKPPDHAGRVAIGTWGARVSVRRTPLERVQEVWPDAVSSCIQTAFKLPSRDAATSPVLPRWFHWATASALSVRRTRMRLRKTNRRMCRRLSLLSRAAVVARLEASHDNLF
jgi:hypothetical protein